MSRKVERESRPSMEERLHIYCIDYYSHVHCFIWQTVAEETELGTTLMQITKYVRSPSRQVACSNDGIEGQTHYKSFRNIAGQKTRQTQVHKVHKE
jgi:hypothetical protein